MYSFKSLNARLAVNMIRLKLKNTLHKVPTVNKDNDKVIVLSL